MRLNYLIASGDEFDHLLKSTSTMRVESDLDHLRGSVTNENSTLLIIRVFQKLLAKVVAKRICMLLVSVAE